MIYRSSLRTRRIHLINPRANTLTTKPLYFNRALYSPLAGLLAVAALIPEDEFEVILTDENIEPVDFDVNADLVGISAMTSYVRRGYEIADQFRRKGIPVILGGVHPSFMPTEALEHADAVVVGEAENVMPQVLDDLITGSLSGIYQSETAFDMGLLKPPRYALLKSDCYINTTYIQTSRGCHQGCTFCAEQLMNGLKVRCRPIKEVIHEIETCGTKKIAFNDADFFANIKRATELMKAMKPLGVRWQAGVNSRAANNDQLLELAAESGCYMLSIGFESVSRETLKSVHKLVNQPDKYRSLVKKIQGYGILVFGLFMFGFDGDDASVFEKTTQFNIEAGFDVCAFSVFTPYPGTLAWFQMLRTNRIFSFDWDKYDQAHIVSNPKNLTMDQLRIGHAEAYQRFYSPTSLLKRFPLSGSRSRRYWLIYNLFFRKGEVTGHKEHNIIAKPTAKPRHMARPPLLPLRSDWQELIQTASPHQIKAEPSRRSHSSYN